MSVRAFTDGHAAAVAALIAADEERRFGRPSRAEPPARAKASPRSRVSPPIPRPFDATVPVEKTGA